jgi:tetratricopeptide (TPR) repeat protein
MAEDLIRLEPNKPAGYAFAGKFLLSRNDNQKGLQRLQKAWELAPNDAINCYMYGLALAKNGNDAEALKQWQKTVDLNPSALDAYHYLADTYAKRQDYKHAMLAIQAIALRKPDDPHVLHTAADYCAKAGQPIAAAYWHSNELRLRRQYPEALASARQVVADPVWRKRGLAEMAVVYRSMNKMDEYLAAMRQVADRKSAEDDVLMANAYGVADKLVEQRQMLKSALDKKPKDPAAVHYLLSQVALRKGLRDEAESELEQAAALAPRNTTFHLELGSLYYERRGSGDRLQKAIHEFTTATQIDPFEVKGYQRLGLAHAAAGDLRRAARELEHAIDLLPGDGVTYQELGRVYARLGDTAGSERMLQLYRMYVAYELQQKTLVTRSRAARNDPESQVALAEFFEKSGDYEAARTYYRLASALRPNDAKLRTKAERLEITSGQNNH